MIHHISIAVENPLHVAQVLAEIWQGDYAPFPGHEGGYMVLALDDRGTMIELLPAGTVLVPGNEGEEQAEFTPSGFNPPFVATHAALSVPLPYEQIERIAAREGWKLLYCNRQGFFDIIELWVENRLLIELLTPQIAQRYIAFMQPENLKQILASAPSPTAELVNA
ncbi:MAG: hypothetical protein ACAF41_09235 [Leptolyngbya sp. BL-A-14]